MTLVDSSVWIDQFAYRETPQTIYLRRMVAGREPVLVGDLIMAEVLQGTRTERDFTTTSARLSLFDQVRIADPEVAVLGARHFRLLRSRGVAVRKTIDTLIATRCILDDIPLLFADRDFQPFVDHLGLRSALRE